MDVCGNANIPLILPIFTVTINPLEDNELTFVPESPTLPTMDTTLDKGTEESSTDNRLLTAAEEREDDERRCSIGSASSLQEENKKSVDEVILGHNHLSLNPDLSIRRVSDISHINELRQGVSGMEHLASEYYEITRDSNPDNVSLDSIHKTVFQRCQHKYIRPERSSRQNQLFVVLTSACTIMGILYGFWYKNFGPGHTSHQNHPS